MFTNSDLSKIASGQDCNAPQVQKNAQPNLGQVTVVPYQPQTDCQQQPAPIATRDGVQINPLNLINETCGVVKVHLVNGDVVPLNFALGGPFELGTASVTGGLYPNVGNGFASATFTAQLGSVVFAAAGNLAGLALLNFYNNRGYSLMLSQVYVQNFDTSIAVNNAFSGSSATPFRIEVANNYTATLVGGIVGTFTSIGSGSLSNVSWVFSTPIPLTSATGVSMLAGVGLDVTLFLCVSAIESNKLYGACN